MASIDHDNVIEVSFTRISDVDDTAIARARAALSHDERRRHDGIHFEDVRREYVVTRALAVEAVSRWLGSRPTFERTPDGRPFVRTDDHLDFNLTNTAELVACAVTRGRIVGIDAERLSRGADVLSVARHVFTPLERAALDPRRAIELWTLKEAYLKARGTGFAIAPASFDVSALAGWAFTSFEIDEHLVSLCCEHEMPVVRRRRVELR